MITKLFICALIIVFKIKITLTFNYTTACECGVVQEARSKRMTGGRDVEYGTQPWFASLVKVLKLENDYTSPFCGGTLISDQYILTAGHCLYNKKAENLRILLDFYDLNEFNQTKHVYEIEKLIVNPNYKDNLKHPEVDIGLIKLSRKVKLDYKILPICLPKINSNSSKRDEYYGFLKTVGWGKTSRNGEQPEKLQQVEMLQDFNTCSLLYGEKFHDSHICLKDARKIKKGWKDVCKGDSGGPLIVKQNEKSEVVGLVSFSNCLGIPASVFTKVKKYISWIQKETSDSLFCQKNSN